MAISIFALYREWEYNNL